MEQRFIHLRITKPVVPMARKKALLTDYDFCLSVKHLRSIKNHGDKGLYVLKNVWSCRKLKIPASVNVSRKFAQWLYI